MNIDGKSTLTEDGKGINSQLDYTVNSLKLQIRISAAAN
jgi:uncharacterized protein YdgA (DUF945 family)